MRCNTCKDRDNNHQRIDVVRQAAPAHRDRPALLLKIHFVNLRPLQLAAVVNVD